jgi:hypothetical protein
MPRSCAQHGVGLTGQKMTGRRLLDQPRHPLPRQSNARHAPAFCGVGCSTAILSISMRGLGLKQLIPVTPPRDVTAPQEGVLSML